MRSRAWLALLLFFGAACGPSVASRGVRLYARADQVKGCDDLGRVSGHANGWGERFRVNAEDDAKESAVKMGANAIVVTDHEASFTGHQIGAEAYKCGAPAPVLAPSATKVMIAKRRRSRAERGATTRSARLRRRQLPA